jgi:DNA modification methylase
MSRWTLTEGDCTEQLRKIDDNTFHSVVTDPPYGIEFMGKAWDRSADYQKWCEEWARECLRVLKPGGYLLAFGGTRTYHRLACAIEDAGFEIRDSIDWIYGSGFPKSLDVSKAIDKAAGAERDVITMRKTRFTASDKDMRSRKAQTDMGYRSDGKPYKFEANVSDDGYQLIPETSPATPEAAQWQGWGTALKPAHEPIVVARKPFSGTVAANVLERGTGGINVDGCRVAGDVPQTTQGKSSRIYGGGNGLAPEGQQQSNPHSAGRWPPNVLLTHSPDCVPTGHTRPVKGSGEPGKVRGRRPGGFANVGADSGTGGANGPTYGTEAVEIWECAPDCPVAEMDRQSGTRPGGSFPGQTAKGSKFTGTTYNNGKEYGGRIDVAPRAMGDTGGASRFFPCFRYQAKAPRNERPSVDGISHPTVKPLELMRWLVRLVTPANGYVLDPFAGSGVTAEACQLEEFDCSLIERDADYTKLISARMRKYETP